MRGFAPRKHPAPSLQPGLHRKTAFCFFSQQHLFRRQPDRNLKLAVIFFTWQISVFCQPISLRFFCPIHADKTANQSAKITAKNNKKRKPQLPYKKMLLQGLINCSYITCCNFCLFVCINYIQRPVHKLIHFGRIFLSAKTY